MGWLIVENPSATAGGECRRGIKEEQIINGQMGHAVPSHLITQSTSVSKREKRAVKPLTPSKNNCPRGKIKRC
jgi:hypothetical protein